MDINQPLAVVRQTKTDFMTIFGLLGLITIFALILHFAISKDAFFNITSFLLVFCGTIAIIIFSGTKDELQELFASMGTIFVRYEYHVSDVAVSYLEYATLCYKDGYRDMKKKSKSMNAPDFFHQLVTNYEDGIEFDDIVDSAHRQKESDFREKDNVVALCYKASDIAPAMGLIGTIIGLVQLLSNLKEPATLGPSMALALLTTLYGAMFAYLFFIPIARKLSSINEKESLIADISIATITSIAKRENPRKLEIKINSLMPENHRVYVFV